MRAPHGLEAAAIAACGTLGAAALDAHLLCIRVPGASRCGSTNVWANLLERLEQRVKDHKKDGPFRGTLIDPLMFRVDAAEWGEPDLYREFRERYLASQEKE
jgi:hypothetical protein